MTCLSRDAKRPTSSNEDQQALMSSPESLTQMIRSFLLLSKPRAMISRMSKPSSLDTCTATMPVDLSISSEPTYQSMSTRKSMTSTENGVSTPSHSLILPHLPDKATRSGIELIIFCPDSKTLAGQLRLTLIPEHTFPTTCI